MDWDRVIERNREALKCVLAALVAMAGLSGETPMLHRHLYRAVLRLLRPAESAARRLIIVAARALATPLQSPHKRQPRQAAPVCGRSGSVTALFPRPATQSINLPLCDPHYSLRRRQRRVSNRNMPRIWCLGMADPAPRPPAPASDSPRDATRLALRLAALGRALDDLPGQAVRFARWRARQQAGLIRPRLSPLRPGPAYASRRPHSSRRPHEVDDILRDTHHFAYLALQRADTS